MILTFFYALAFTVSIVLVGIAFAWVIWKLWCE